MGALENLTLLGSAAINCTGNGLDNVSATPLTTFSAALGAPIARWRRRPRHGELCSSSAGVTVSLMTGLGSGGDAEGDTLLRIEYLTGSASGRYARGQCGGQRVAGGDGVDTVAYERALSRPSPSTSPSPPPGTEHHRRRHRLPLSGFENLTGSALNDTLIGSRRTTPSWDLPATIPSTAAGAPTSCWVARATTFMWSTMPVTAATASIKTSASLALFASYVDA